MRVFVTGGAGFVGANVAIALAARGHDVVALDSLRRRGSELNLPRLREAGVEFSHGDVRNPADLRSVGGFDALLECSAEPSVLAGQSDAEYAVHTNLLGAHNCLELVRRHDAQLIFLSTSRVYPIAALNGLAYEESETRFELAAVQRHRGASVDGISEEFPLEGARTLYGATKLAAELLIAEYGAGFGIDAVVDRCGVIAGPWQMGRVDQGVYTYWVLNHYLRRGLTYIGYGGSGKQVRDLLHVDDLVELIDDQLARRDHWSGVTVNVGGGRDGSLSLREATEICREVTGNRVEIRPAEDARPGDVPLYVSDCARLSTYSDWAPRRGPRQVLEDIFNWIHANESAVVGALT